MTSMRLIRLTDYFVTKDSFRFINIIKYVKYLQPLKELSLFKTRHMREYKHSLTFRVRRYVVRATKRMHWLQIRPKLHNYRAPSTIPQSYIRVRAVVLACGDEQTDRLTHRQTHTDARDQYALCLKKVPMCKLFVTLSDLNRFALLKSVSNLLQNPYNSTHLTSP